MDKLYEGYDLTDLGKRVIQRVQETRANFLERSLPMFDSPTDWIREFPKYAEGIAQELAAQDKDKGKAEDKPDPILESLEELKSIVREGAKADKDDNTEDDSDADDGQDDDTDKDADKDE